MRATTNTLDVYKMCYETYCTLQSNPLRKVGSRPWSIPVKEDMAVSTIVVLMMVIAAALAVPAPEVQQSRNAQILRYELDTNQLPDFYRFSYDASDGSSRTEEGQINNAGTPQAALHVFGSTRWVAQNGGVYEMTYKAGKRGYRTIIKKIS